jgi:prophage regulatory protein
MDVRLLRLKQVLEYVPVSKSTWWSWVADSKAPAPIKLGRCTFWRYSEIMDLIESQEVGNEK